MSYRPNNPWINHSKKKINDKKILVAVLLSEYIVRDVVCSN